MLHLTACKRANWTLLERMMVIPSNLIMGMSRLRNGVAGALFLSGFTVAAFSEEHAERVLEMHGSSFDSSGRYHSGSAADAWSPSTLQLVRFYRSAAFCPMCASLPQEEAASRGVPSALSVCNSRGDHVLLYLSITSGLHLRMLPGKVELTYR